MTVANKEGGEVRLQAFDPRDIPHCWAQGPLDVRKTSAKYNVRYRADGTRYYRRTNWEFLWYLNEVRGTTRTIARKAINRVLHHPYSWERTGCRWRETDAAQADIYVNVIPKDETVCGPGSAGCYSWGFRGPKPLAEMGVEYTNDPEGFAELVNMELCGHGTFRMHDMYFGEGHDVNEYNGVMGTWNAARSTGYYPSDAEIAEAKLWLAGKAQFVHEHGGGGAQADQGFGHDHSEHDHSGHSH